MRRVKISAVLWNDNFDTYIFFENEVKQVVLKMI